jgi:hypothetical protein
LVAENKLKPSSAGMVLLKGRRRAFLTKAGAHQWSLTGRCRRELSPIGNSERTLQIMITFIGFFATVAEPILGVLG